jgi:hypothetical protein
MNPLKFVKNVSETYFAEKSKSWRNYKYVWDFLFISFFALYLIQIYSAYIDWERLVVLHAVNKWEWDFFTPDRFWQTKLSAIFLQGIVLLGVFIRFLAGQFRGRWFFRFGEFGGLIAIATLFNHYQWTVSVQSQFFQGNSCSSPGLLGMMPFASQWLMLFFFCWVLYKFTFLIAVTWVTVRK